MSAKPSSISSSRPARPAPATTMTPNRKAGVVGAVVGAVVGGVLGAVLVKKARAAGPKRLIPAKVPEVGKRALAAVKDVASDAMVVAKTTAGIATDAAISHMKTAAQQFVVDVATGTPPSPPNPTPPSSSTNEVATHPSSAKSAPAANKPSGSRAPTARKKTTASRRAKASKKPKLAANRQS